MTDRLEQLLKLIEADDTDPFLTYALAMEHIKHHQTDPALTMLDRTI